MNRTRFPSAGKAVWQPVCLTEPTLQTLDEVRAAGLAGGRCPRVPLALLNTMIGQLSVDGVEATCAFVEELQRAGGYLPPGHPWDLDEPAWTVLVLARLHPRGRYAWGIGLLREARVDMQQAEMRLDELSSKTPGRWLLIRHPGRPPLGLPYGQMLP